MRSSKSLLLSFRLLRHPLKSTYYNWRDNPPDTLFGYANLLKDNYLYRKIPLRHSAVIIFDWFNQSGWTKHLVSCHWEMVGKSFENLGTALQIPPISNVNVLKDWRYERIPFDTVSVKLADPSAVADLDCEWRRFDTCDAAENPRDNRKSLDFNLPFHTDPDEPVSEPGDGFEYQISESYEPPDDGGLTYSPIPPEGDFPDCTLVNAFVQTYSGGVWSDEYIVQVYAPILDVRVRRDERADLQFLCRGVLPAGDSCGDLKYYNYGGSGNPLDYEDFRLNKVELSQ